MNLRMSPLYSDLDRGDGVCRYFNCNIKLCSIYENRPEKCNVDKTYERYYKETMSKEQYYKLNYEACERLKKERKKDVSSNIE
ncbi:Fe-S-cluster containining protein [Hathewaya limosa]|uniref:Fe-S-cluster containining protein n=2 Tax=Hathewaya limosa TaxID=1536 RepID=A0ABU0JVV0_HATLI|nr:Fe-S-cluster containining protein [Hathewaya limosa]